MIIDTNLVTESQEIHSQNCCENNSSGDKEEVIHEEVTLIKTYKEALTEIKNLHRFAIDQQNDKQTTYRRQNSSNREKTKNHSSFLKIQNVYI